MTRTRFAALSSMGLGLALALSACGGGGSSGPVTSTPNPVPSPSPTPTPTPTPTSSEPSAEYTNSLPVNYAKAHYAYEQGYTGEGVTIAIIDTGIDIDNPEFEGRISEDSVSIPVTYARCATCDVEQVEYELDDIQGHGTWVASVAAGAANNNSVHGVAYDSTILAIKVAGADLSNLEDGQDPLEAGLNGNMVPSAIHYAVDHGAFVINLSANGTTSGRSAEQFNEAMDAVVENDLLFVQSVSNYSGDEFAGSLTEALVGTDLENADWFLYGIRVDNHREPIDGNGSPGPLAHRTLAVAAQSIVVIDVDGGTTRVSGNSFAAPTIAGAAALLKQYWPQLGGAAIADILLTTATDMGEPGVDQLYGVGLLNIEEAFKADNAQMGASSMNMKAVKDTGLAPSAPFGSSSAGRAFNTEDAPTFALDSWGREYQIDASALVSTGDTSSLSLGNLVQADQRPTLTPYEATLGSASFAASNLTEYDQQAPQSFGARLGMRTAVFGSTNSSIAPSRSMSNSLLRSANVPTNGTVGTIAHAGHRLTVGVASRNDEDAQNESLRVSLELPSGVNASYTQSTETGSALGMRGFGAFAIDGARSDFVSVGWSGNVEGFALQAEAMAGATDISTSGSMLSLNSPVLSTGFQILAERPALGGTLLLGLTSPIKVDRADVTYTAAYAYDLDTHALVHRDNQLDLSAGARELDFELGYERSLFRGQIALNAGYALNAGNDAGEHAAAASLRFNTSF
ncbi:S8 family peptidase [Erythrobacter aureus]|uniref:S8 family peptidase n=1 Tax=Erythrobacter aureus TaxID=2182384 RepID=UPI0013B467E9|nr:S8 family serine peptidase [Erythrobacter aureus]